MANGVETDRLTVFGCTIGFQEAVCSLELLREHSEKRSYPWVLGSLGQQRAQLTTLHLPQTKRNSTRAEYASFWNVRDAIS
jgi:hypothetical protein